MPKGTNFVTSVNLFCDLGAFSLLFEVSKRLFRAQSSDRNQWISIDNNFIYSEAQLFLEGIQIRPFTVFSYSPLHKIIQYGTTIYYRSNVLEVF